MFIYISVKAVLLLSFITLAITLNPRLSSASGYTATDGTLYMTFSSEDGRSVDQGEEEGITYVWYWRDNLSITPGFAIPIPALVEWSYLYWGDANGQYVQLGKSYIHNYGIRARFNPTLIVKTETSLHMFTFLAFSTWNYDEDPQCPLPNFEPEPTGDPLLDALLRSLALDNSEFTADRQGSVCGCKEIDESGLWHCRECNVKVRECEPPYCTHKGAGCV